MSSPLPPRANLEHLRNEAKQRLKTLREQDPSVKLADAQLVIAREYGFASWRRLKAAVDEQDRRRVFAAARAGDVETIRRALQHGFNAGATDTNGQTIHQIAKTLDHTDLELFMRVHQERDERGDDVKRAVRSILEAAAEGRADELRGLLSTRIRIWSTRRGPAGSARPRSTGRPGGTGSTACACCWITARASRSATSATTPIPCTSPLPRAISPS